MKTDQFQKRVKESLTFALLFQTALTGKNMDFEFIRCWEHRKVARYYLRALRKILRDFKKVAKAQDQLVKALTKAGKLNFLNLKFADQLHECVKFYKKECAVVKDMLSEYREYVCSGHLIDTFVLPRLRTDYELVDYRTLPGVWIFKKPI